VHRIRKGNKKNVNSNVSQASVDSDEKWGLGHLQKYKMKGNKKKKRDGKKGNQGRQKTNNRPIGGKNKRGNSREESRPRTIQQEKATRRF